MRSFATVASALAVLAPLASAQTFSDCNPMKKDCPNNPGLNQADYTVDFSKGLPSDWVATAGSIDGTADGGRFRIAKIGDGPTVQSKFYFFYGKIEAKVKVAPGAGIVSSIVLESDDLDEIDWEWIGSETTRGQSNYFGKGNTTTYDRGGFHDVATPAATWHTYGIDWTQNSITWSIDNNPVRTLNYADANGGRTFPQTPMNIRIGNWIGGAPGNAPGTITWAGGPVDTSKGPFDMMVSTVTVKNYNPGSEYKYGDKSGNTQSIQIIKNGQTSTVSGHADSGSSAGSASGSSDTNKQIDNSPAPSSAPTGSASQSGMTTVVQPSASKVSNATYPTAKLATPTAAVPSSSAKANLTLSNGAASGFQAPVVGTGLLAVLGLFLGL